MRNIFDQYSQYENRVTHALMTALDRDRRLLAAFLKSILKIQTPIHVSKLHIVEQRLPDELEPNEVDLDDEGIPDGWIFDDGGFCIFIESKVQSKLRTDQILRHHRTAKRLGFKHAHGVAIVADLPKLLPSETIILEWVNIYTRLQRHRLTGLGNLLVDVLALGLAANLPTYKGGNRR